MEITIVANDAFGALDLLNQISLLHVLVLDDILSGDVEPSEGAPELVAEPVLNALRMESMVARRQDLQQVPFVIVTQADRAALVVHVQVLLVDQRVDVFEVFHVVVVQPVGPPHRVVVDVQELLVEDRLKVARPVRDDDHDRHAYREYAADEDEARH